MNNKDRVGPKGAQAAGILESPITPSLQHRFSPLKAVKSLKPKAAVTDHDYSLRKGEGADRTFRKQFCQKLAKGYSWKSGKRNP